MTSRRIFSLALIFAGFALMACHRQSLYMDDDRKPAPSRHPTTSPAPNVVADKGQRP
jgi:hypothetical protein